jgi:hypothetical protein
MAAKPRSKANSPGAARATFKVKNLKAKFGSKTVPVKVDFVTLPPGATIKRKGPVRGMLITHLERGVTRLARTTTTKGLRPDRVVISYKPDQVFWVPETPRGVEVELTNVGSTIGTFGKIYPEDGTGSTRRTSKSRQGRKR